MAEVVAEAVREHLERAESSRIEDPRERVEAQAQLALRDLPAAAVERLRELLAGPSDVRSAG